MIDFLALYGLRDGRFEVEIRGDFVALRNLESEHVIPCSRTLPAPYANAPLDHQYVTPQRLSRAARRPGGVRPHSGRGAGPHGTERIWMGAGWQRWWEGPPLTYEQLIDLIQRWKCWGYLADAIRQDFAQKEFAWLVYADIEHIRSDPNFYSNRLGDHERLIPVGIFSFPKGSK